MGAEPLTAEQRKLAQRIREEMRPEGRACNLLATDGRALPHPIAIALSTEAIVNLEERLVEIESGAYARRT